MLDLVLYHTPNFYIWMVRWYYVAPAAAVIVGGLFLISVWRVWFEKVGGNLTAIKLLPPWLLSADNDADRASLSGRFTTRPNLRAFTLTTRVKAVEIPNPKWLTIQERGLYTGVSIFGAVGSARLGLYAAVRTANLVLGRPAIPGAGRLASANGGASKHSLTRW